MGSIMVNIIMGNVKEKKWMLDRITIWYFSLLVKRVNSPFYQITLWVMLKWRSECFTKFYSLGLLTEVKAAIGNKLYSCMGVVNSTMGIVYYGVYIIMKLWYAYVYFVQNLWIYIILFFNEKVLCKLVTLGWL